jgi:CubicO group peptidase (beta-lactamase class C family)
MRSEFAKYFSTLFIITALNIILIGGTCADLLPKVEVTQEKLDRIRQVMELLAENGQFSGTVLVAVHGEVIYEQAFGYANLEWSIPNTLDTKFRIASATKPFTTMLILQLIAEGKMRLDSKLIDYVPEFTAEKGEDITIEHLITHRSGVIGESRIPDLDDIERLHYTQDELLDYICRQNLVFAPGTKSEYSNFGFYLLGVIIERASGLTYAQCLEEKICQPAGMKNTIPDQNTPIIGNRASGYHFDYITGPGNAPYLDMTFVVGPGHLLSTVRDLYLWDNALYTRKLLSEEYKDRFFGRYFWKHYRTPVGKHGQRVLSNYLSGSINGFASHILRIEQDSIFIAILKNMKELGNQIVIKWPEYITSRLLAILYDQEYDLPKKSAAYAVFRKMLEDGVAGAEEFYSDITENQGDRYYIDEDEFGALGKVLYNANMLEETPAFFELIYDNEDAAEMIRQIRN